MKKRQPILNFVLIILCVIIIAPFLLIVGVSLSNEKDVLVDGYRFIPKHFDLSAYKYLFSDPTHIINAYRVTIIQHVSSGLSCSNRCRLFHCYEFVFGCERSSLCSK